MKVDQLISELGLSPHPEGGYFKETYRSNLVIQTESGVRQASTGIYYLLENDDFSAFHRIKSDEMWHFYAGSPLEVHSIDQEGNHLRRVLGLDIANGQQPQFVVPSGHWFGSRIQNDTGFSLVGCTVAPGFDFADFEIARAEDLLLMYPTHSEIIHSLTR